MYSRLLAIAALVLALPGAASAHDANPSKVSDFTIIVNGHEVAMPDPLVTSDQTPSTTPEGPAPTATPKPTAQTPPTKPPFTYKPDPKPLETTVIDGVTYSITGKGFNEDRTSIYTYFSNPAPAEWAQFITQGQEYWASQGRALDCPEGVSVLTADLPANTIAVAKVTGCKTWVSVHALDNTYSPWAKCTVMVHEYGHMTGLEHTDGGIMDGKGGIFANHIPQCEPFSNMVTGPVTVIGFTAAMPVGTDKLEIPQPKTLTGADARKNAAELLGRKWKIGGCKRITPLKVNCVARKSGKRVTVKVKMSLRSGDNRFYKVTAPWTTMGYLAGPVTA